MKSGIRSRRHAEMLLAGVIAARATSYLFSKLIMEGMGMFNLLGIRFLLAFPNFRGDFPTLEAKLYLIWNRYQAFTPIAERFLAQVRSSF